MHVKTVPAVLSIAGSDSSGGAGIQADIKTIVAHRLFAATAVTALTAQNTLGVRAVRLFPLATVITPNIREAEALSGRAIATAHDQQTVASELVCDFGCAALVKGGHNVNDANDVLAERASAVGDAPRTTWFRHPRVDTANTHGTGCTLSSAIACGLAQDLILPDAVSAAKGYLTGALAAGLDLGSGSGPVNHMWQY